MFDDACEVRSDGGDLLLNCEATDVAPIHLHQQVHIILPAARHLVAADDLLIDIDANESSLEPGF